MHDSVQPIIWKNNADKRKAQFGKTLIATCQKDRDRRRDADISKENRYINHSLTTKISYNILLCYVFS